MTNPLGAGTCNLQINARLAERSLYGQLSFQRIQAGEFRSMGDYLRYLLLRGLEAENPAAARRLREIRNATMAAALTLMVCGQMVAVWMGKDDAEAMRRAQGQRVRVVHVVRVGRARFETEAA